ncbi:HD domain-containing protein [Aquipseudomonas campi]|uniref:HD domain-containing protein n=1 Tax=Aquipseudomonas campi TaxID=2731681 RepID=A0A6M8FS49_9GAMM|nr:HD domain-containing phosphohydrolase [Pseudomonas campi]QKE63618.1 HD domain-containing protein [Pseudomonas campi]
MNGSPADEPQVNYIALTAGQIQLGKPLPWPVYDARGGLLLNQGFVISSPGQLERLLERGLFQAKSTRTQLAHAVADATYRVNPFAEYGELLEHLETTLDRLLNQQPEAERRVLTLGKRIDQICQADADACLALVHIYSVEPTAHEQTLFHAILCNLLARHLQLEASQIVALMGAALTANIALLRHQDKLNGMCGDLSPAQRSIVNKHPTLSAQAVSAAGVSSPVWLQIIEQHHERGSGEGYPLGLQEGQIRIEALILSLAERYTAMITKRAYRNRFSPAQAMHLLEEESHEGTTEAKLLKELRQLLTPYPPGCFIRLNNSETAIVTRRAADSLAPKVRAVTSAKGNPYLGSFSRDTQHEDFRPCEYIEPLHLPSVNIPTLWGYG